MKSASPYIITDKKARWIIIPFLIETGNDKVMSNKNDHDELKWVNLEELSKVEDLQKDIKELQTRGLIQ